MQHIHANPQLNPHSGRLNRRRALNQLCAEAIRQQIESGEAAPTHLRNRRRHLAKQILKRIPHAGHMSPKKLFHAAMMVLAMWGFGGLTVPQQAEAAPVFKHGTLAGFDVGLFAKPSFADIDNDGDLDAFVGEVNGTVKFYRNDDASGNGTAPNFVAVAGAGNPLAGVSAGFLVGIRTAPTFADIDNDGDLDAFVGGLYGKVKFYRNDDVSGNGTAPNFVAVAGAGNPLNVVSVGQSSAPVFADIDNDGDLDAFVGVDSAGAVTFYRNDDISGNGTAPNFVAVAGAGNPLAAVAVGGHPTPTFADIDNDGDLDAFVGELYGTVKFYRNDDASGNGTAPNFVAVVAGNPLAAVAVGWYAAPTFADIDNDGDLDAFVGERYGTVKFYRNYSIEDGGTASAPRFVADLLAGFNVGRRAKPSFADIDNDGDLDAFIGEYYGGKVKFYRNNGTATIPTFAADMAGNPLAGVAVGRYAAPTFADIDNDGDLDAFVGEEFGTVKFYRNDDASGNGTAPNFVAVAGAGNPLAAVAVGWYAAPTFADIDNDGDLDAFVGEEFGTVKFYRNDDASGNGAAPNFVAVAGAGNPLAAVAVGWYAAPTFADIDNDGDLDAFVGELYGTVKFYRNDDASGNGTAPNFVAVAGAGNPLAGVAVGRYAAPTFADIDNDGDLDAFVGERYGTVKFVENFDPSPVAVADNLTATTGLAATTVDVTANDTFKPEGPAAGFTITAFTQGANGTVINNGNNTFTYTSGAGFAGADSFTYTLDDGVGNTAIGTVNVTVNPIFFTDVQPTHWAFPFIQSMFSSGVTSGCGGGNFCPNNNVTRAEMAVFLERGMNGGAFAPPPATGLVFTDVPTTGFAASWIEQLSADGITSGCGGGNYCPTNNVTRAEMAVFLERGKNGAAFTPPAATGLVFADVPTTGFAAAWIEQLSADGITSGCGGGNFCPTNNVTRAEMAVFLVNAFNLPL